MLGECIASQSEVIRAVVSGYIVHSVGAPHRAISLYTDFGMYWNLAVGESSAILLHPPLPSVAVSVEVERERQQNDRTLANGHWNPTSWVSLTRCDLKGAQPEVIRAI